MLAAAESWSRMAPQVGFDLSFVLEWLGGGGAIQARALSPLILLSPMQWMQWKT